MFTTFTIERKLGHHEIISHLGTGGTGGICPLRVLAVIAISFAPAMVAAAENNLSTREQTQILSWMLPSRIRASGTTCSPLTESLPGRVSRKSAAYSPTLSLEPCFSGSSSRNHRQSSNPSDHRICVDGQHSCSR